MSITEVSMMHHVCIVMLGLWFLCKCNLCHLVTFVISIFYLYLIHERYFMRLRKKIQFEDMKESYRRRVLTDSETVRWLNHVVEKVWPIFMEQISSQKFLLPIVPWFLEKFKPWTVNKASIQSLYLGSKPPLLTEVRVIHQATGDDHLVLQVGVNFISADDISAIFAVKLRKALGFGILARLHMTGMQVEGKVLIGMKFIPTWPFISRLRLCFAEPPYFQMTLKPMSSYGLDVTEIPGVSGWIDKLLSDAFEQTLVEPNMLVVDVEKLVLPQQGSKVQQETWFSVDAKEPVAYARVVVIEASNMKPSSLNGLADPYVRGRLGPYRFKTQVQKKTLAPNWHEEFRIPIISWESPNVLNLAVLDKDHFIDDDLGNCSVNINDLRDGKVHDLWLPLKNVRMGKLHVSITTLQEGGQRGDVHPFTGESMDREGRTNSLPTDVANQGCFSSLPSEKFPRPEEELETINIEGLKDIAVWIYHPGSDISHVWEPRKGKARRLDTRIYRECNASDSDTAASVRTVGSKNEGNRDGKHSKKSIWRGIEKIGLMFRMNSRDEDSTSISEEGIPSPPTNIKAVNPKDTGDKLVLEDSPSMPGSSDVSRERNSGVTKNEDSSSEKGKMKDVTRSFLRSAEKSPHRSKHVFPRKGLRRSPGDSSSLKANTVSSESSYSADKSFSPPLYISKVEPIPIDSHPLPATSTSTFPKT